MIRNPDVVKSSFSSKHRFLLVSCDNAYNEETGYWDATNAIWREILTQ